MLGNLLKYLKTIKEYYVEHDIEYKKAMDSEDEYIIAIFIRVKATEDQVRGVIPMLDTFLKTLLQKGKIAVPMAKNKIEKIKKMTRLRLRVKGIGVVDNE